MIGAWTVPVLTTPTRLRAADLDQAQAEVSAALGAQITTRGAPLWGWLVLPQRGESSRTYARRATAYLAARWTQAYGDGEVDAASVEAARWIVAR